MKTQELFELIDGIDDDIILDIPQLNAEKPTKITVQKRTPVWNYVSIAACFVCVLAAGIFAVTKIYGNITTSLPVTPSDMTGSGAASSIPENNSAPVQTSEPGQTVPYYDDVFKELEPVNPVVGEPMTYDDHMDIITSPYEQAHGIFLDSFYLVETIRALSGEEACALQGWDILCEGRTIYEVRLLKDLISGETVDRVEKIIVPHGTPDRQTPGDPSYAPGERFTALLAKPPLVGDFLQSPSSKDFRYDVVENGSEIIVYSRGSDLDKLGLPGSENIEEQVITSTTQNPAVYTQKLGLDELVSFLRKDWEQRKVSSHFEPVPTDKAVSTTGQTGSPDAYLNTRPVTFSEAEDQIDFTDVKKITSADFVGYEIEYVMPSNYPLALNYVYSGGRVSVSDNSGDSGKLIISPEWYEKIERGNMIFWRSLLYDNHAAVYISEYDTVYFAEFVSDADLSKAIETIMSLL